MNDSTVKQIRQILRQVQSHLTEVHVRQGAEQEQVGLVEVLHHPTSTSPELNYVTPRKNTAWVSIPEVTNGLKVLKNHARALRVMFIEGLFIPAFGDRLASAGLARESELRVMALQLDPMELETVSPDEFDSDETLTLGTMAFVNVSSRAESALWWYLWRNAHYDVVTQTAELRFIESSFKQISDGHQVDLIMRIGGIPAGVASLTLSTDRTSAQISSFALARETRSLPHAQQLLEEAIEQAKAKGISMIFFALGDVLLNTASQALGFVDCGGIVCYAEATDPFPTGASHDALAAALPLSG
jgi:ribosomal protein S18 acetylase RimI-like enzyme